MSANARLKNEPRPIRSGQVAVLVVAQGEAVARWFRGESNGR